MEQETTSKTQTESSELELTQIIKRVWSHRKIVYIITGLIVLFGTVWAFTAPKEYTANTKVLSAVQTPSRGASRLSSLASLAGLNLSTPGASNELSPSVYPEIISSLPFQEAVLAAEVDSRKYGGKLTLQDYLLKSRGDNKQEWLKKYTLGLPKTILRALKPKPANNTNATHNNPSESNELLQLSGEQSAAIGLLRQALNLTFDETSGTISLQFVLNEPKPAAQATLSARKVLEERVKEFKIQKAKNQLTFIEELYEEKKSGYEAAQRELSAFRDANRIISSSKGYDEQQQLQDRYNLAFSLFNQVSNQLETKKIEVQENVPVFSIIQPVIVPKSNSGPNRFQTIFVALFVGIFLGLMFVFIKEFKHYVLSRW